MAVAGSGLLEAVGDGDARIALETDEWSIEVDGVIIRSSDLSLSADPDASVERFLGAAGAFAIAVDYRAITVAERRAVQRIITVSGDGPFRVGRVSFRVVPAEPVHDAFELRTFSESPFAAVARLDRLSLLTGVQNPHTTTSVESGILIEYSADLVATDSFQTSAQFFAVTERSGVTLQPVHPKSRTGVGEARPRGRFRNPSEARAIDTGEIGALRAVVRDYLQPLPERNRFILYTYWYPLPHAPETPADERRWVDTIDNFADLGGELLLTVPIADATTPTASSDAYWDLEPEGSSAARIMNHARELGLEVGYYMGVAAGNLPYSNAPGLGLPLDGPDAWRKVRSDGTLALENCLAHEDYARWLESVSANTIERFGLSAWSWDPGPGDGAHCFASHHGHEPGRGEHLGWLRGMALARALHARFPGLHLQGYYGQKQDGTWGLAGISQHEGYWEQQGEWGGGLYPEVSAERLNANGVRHQAWWSQNFRFLPAETNHALFGRMSQICVEDPVLADDFDWWGWRFGLLSAIAVGGAPTAATLPPRDAPAALRDEYRWWLEWARTHARPCLVDVAGGAQVELGAGDWYLRFDGDEAHLFVCNPGARSTRVAVPLAQHLPVELLAGARLIRLQDTGADAAPDDSPVPDVLELEVPASDVLAFTISRTPERVARRTVPSNELPGSAMVAVDRWWDDSGAAVTVAPAAGTTARRIRTVLPALPRPLDTTHWAAELRERLPLIPETFAYVDVDRVVLVIPLLDADAVGELRVRVGGADARAEVFEYVHTQMGRYSIAPPDLAQWPESKVVWWCDLTPYLGAEPVDLVIELPDLGPEQFLGPYVQVPLDLASTYAVLSDSTAGYAGRPFGSLPPLTPAGEGGPRVLDAWIEQHAVPSNSEFTLFARAENADEVYAGLHVGSGSLSDRRMTPVEGQPGLWRLDAHVYRRAAIILDRSAAVIWATRGTEVGDDHRVAIPWELDPLESTRTGG
ncbi:hypothetical protein [Antiquaquibacter soli]|uniref:Uncharacterized protein n=1 Tax=Antiquaquibacter soli TaxID=3064523 RepID=A0ABT9BR11_9MICO|nr:hypothetical protein [Protaetiibacter sp. WY-16]MDO7883074.1 hypothetical protein [Protaetiibacter sp. WY-16]